MLRCPGRPAAVYMRLAVLYDYLETIGGGERVALTLSKHFDADLVTTAYDETLPARAGYPGVRVTSLGSIRGRTPVKQIRASLRFSRATLSGYDAYVLVGNWAHFAARRHHPNLYYCLTPTRFFYDQREATLARLPASRRPVARAWVAVHSAFDRRAVSHCNRIVAISENVRGRIQRYYARPSDVIYPPVATHRFHFEDVGDAWLSVNRLYPEKRIGVQFDIFRRLPQERLLVVGGYTMGDRTEAYIGSLVKPANVTLLGDVPEDELVRLYARCKGFLTTAVDEDFGITPVEAMAAGKCVLATDDGGYRETVIEGKTGFLLPPEADAFAAKIRELDEGTLRGMRNDSVARASQFDESVFLRKMESVLGV